MKKRILTSRIWRIGLGQLVLLLAISYSVLAQNKVNGVVKDELGEPLIGVTVMIVGTTQGTSTDIDGKYALSVPENTVLRFSFIGYIDYEIAVDGKTEINVDMKVSADMLDEIVIQSYGVTKARDVTGSVASVKSEELQQVATVDVVQAMQGRMAGVNVIANSGEPGSGSKIRVRGIGTINNSDPLYVVDGYQVSSIDFLSPNDIESIEVLKDASATAIYGSRGANGVVLIKTKKGTSQQTQFAFDAYTGVQTLRKQIDMLNAAEYAELRLEAFENDGIALDTDGDLYTRLDFVQQGNYQGTNWQDEIFAYAAVMSNYALSVMGGSEKQKYSISASYFTQDGLVKHSGMDKFFARFNNQLSLTPWLNAGVTAAYINVDKTNYNGDLFFGTLTTALRADPVTPAYDVLTGNYGRADLSSISNPARIVEESQYNKTNEHKLVTNVWAEATFLKDFKFKSQFGFDVKNAHNKIYLPAFFIATDETRDQSQLFEQRAEQQSWVWSNYVTYNKEIAEHTIGAMVGVEAQYSKYRTFNATALDVPESADLQFLSAAKNTDFTVNSGQSQEALQSLFGRVNYTYKGRYILTSTLRYDGSSRFLEDYRWGVFPSFSAAWLVSEESFLDDFEKLSFLKVRAGWGQVGNQNSVGNYSYVTRFSNNQLYVFNGEIVQGAATLSLGNPEIQWETTETLNAGVDLRFFDDQLSVTADYFIKNTNDMILQVPIPVYAGTGKPYANAGSMQNKGIELAVGYRNSNNAIHYGFNFNISKINNQITALGSDNSPIEAGSITKVGNTTRTEVGREIAYFYGHETDGIFNTQAELDAHVNTEGTALQPQAQLGDVKFIDANDDGVIDDNDKVYLGSATPDFTYGFGANASYKGFDISLFIAGSQGNEVVNGLSRFTMSSDGKENSVAARLDRWTPENPNSNEPRMTSIDANKNIERFSDRYVQDGSYLRLRNVQLGYSLPESITNKLSLGSLRIYVAADNLLTLTGYTGWDPEIGDLYNNPLNYGIDLGNYPSPRTYRAGLSLKF